MARADMFLKVHGQKTGAVRGEANDAAFVGQIEIVSWGWGISAPSAVGGGNLATGRRLLKPLVVNKLADCSSTALMIILAGNELVTATLSVRKAGGSALPYFVVKLEQARIVDYTVDSGLSSDGAPSLLECVSFTFNKINVTHTPQGTTGAGEGASEFEDEVGEV